MATKKTNEVLNNIKARSADRFLSMANKITGRKLIVIVTEQGDNVSFGDLMSVYDWIFAEDLETLEKLFNDDAAKLDELFKEIIQEPSAKK